MVIDFNDVPVTTLEHFNGGEGALLAHMCVDPNGLGKVLKGYLEPGSTIGLHTHATSSEIIYILEGEGHVLYDGQMEAVSAGQCHICPKGKAHSLINDSDARLSFFAVVPEQ